MDYKALYLRLFNELTTAIEAIAAVVHGLKQAQLDAESMYIEGRNDS